MYVPLKMFVPSKIPVYKRHEIINIYLCTYLRVHFDVELLKNISRTMPLPEVSANLCISLILKF